MDPYRGDRDALLAMVAAAEQRATRAEERARVAEAALKRRRRGLWMQAGGDEILVIRRGRESEYVEPGGTVFGWRATVAGALPATKALIQAHWNDLEVRDGTASIHLTVLVGVGRDSARRDEAVRHFLDRPAHEMADRAAPILEATLRNVLHVRQLADLASLDRIAQDLRFSSQSALRDLGLEVGDVVLHRHGVASQ